MRLLEKQQKDIVQWYSDLIKHMKMKYMDTPAAWKTNN